MRSSYALSAAIAFLFTTGCSPNGTIPPANQDMAPTITWNAFIVQQPSGYSGDVEPGKANVSATTSVNVTEGAHVQLSGSASNPGGVQTLHMTVQQGGEMLGDVTSTATSGQVPTVLNILGSNGAGGTGSQPVVVVLTKPVTVTVSATNFNAMNQKITVTYNPSPVIIVGGGGTNQPPPPSTAQIFLTANHDLGPFQSTTAPPNFCQATLTWNLTPGTLSGTAGSNAPFHSTATANPAPSWMYDASSGLYTARCGYGQMVGGLRPGTWTAAVAATGTGTDWQTQCSVTLAVGMNYRKFQWGQNGCQ